MSFDKGCATLDGMRSFHVFAVVAGLVACSPPVPESPPPSTPRSSPPPVDTSQQMIAESQRQGLEAGRAAYAQATAEGDAFARAEMQRMADKKAAEEKLADLLKLCEDTRVARVRNATDMILARMEAEVRMYTNAKAIRASCKIVVKHTGSTNIQRSGSGWRVSPEMRDDLTCGALPAGITKDTAYVLLSRDRAGESKPTGKILEPEDHDKNDSVCERPDKLVGLDLDAATYADPKAPGSPVGWKAP